MCTLPSADIDAFLAELVAGTHDAAFPSGSNIALDAGKDAMLLRDAAARLRTKRLAEAEARAAAAAAAAEADTAPVAQ